MYQNARLQLFIGQEQDVMQCYGYIMPLKWTVTTLVSLLFITMILIDCKITSLYLSPQHLSVNFKLHKHIKSPKGYLLWKIIIQYSITVYRVYGGFPLEYLRVYFVSLLFITTYDPCKITIFPYAYYYDGYDHFTKVISEAAYFGIAVFIINRCIYIHMQHYQTVL